LDGLLRGGNRRDPLPSRDRPRGASATSTKMTDDYAESAS
jgi:hypothetical protein